jgi:hypothetical protein
MFSWLEKDIPIAASILFRGTWPCTREGFYPLRERGIEVTDRETPTDGIWAIKLKHPQWGEAVAMALRDFPLPPKDLIDWDANLTSAEKEEFKACGTAISMTMTSRRNHLLRDRKCALQFMNLLAGEEGVGGVDHLSGRFWSKNALKAETAHDADVDVESLFTAHLVVNGAEPKPETDDLLADDAEEKPVTRWFHTHGLAEIGLFDFDILNPSNSALHQTVNAIAFAILEGKLKKGGSAELFSKSGQIVAVPVKEFMAKAAPEWTTIRDDPQKTHVEDRVVLCEMATSRWFGRVPSQMRPAKSLRDDFPDDTLIAYSNEATELMAQRARATYSVFRELRREVGEIELPCLVKIGYQTDGGRTPSDREHLWFQVHEARENEVDATLVNEPFAIKRLKQGQRAVHPIDALTDWQILTPHGSVNPRSVGAVSLLREYLAKVRANGGITK